MDILVESDYELAEITGGDLVSQLWYNFIMYGFMATTHASVKYGVTSLAGH